jgi:thiamine-monophosphate kinase
VSDGLLGDLGKLCVASGVGATLDARRLPLSAELVESAGPEAAATLALTAGDDYELLFTAPAAHRGALEALRAGVACRRIGVVTAGSAVLVDGAAVPRDAGHGFDHFAG